MFTVMGYDEMVMDEVEVFEGTLEECETFIEGMEDELYIVEPDGYTVH